MSFAKGFSKTAGAYKGIGKAIGSAVGGAVGGARRLGKYWGRTARELESGIQQGSAAAERKLLGKKPLKHDIAKVLERHNKIEKAREAAKPSFARKHPIITGIGAAMLYNKVMGDSQKSPEERIYNPNS